MAKSTLPVRWAPPTLKAGYTVVDLNKTGSQDWFQFAPDEDVVFIASNTTRTLPRLHTSGGHNIIVVGGEYTPAAGTTADATLKFGNVTGEVWIEGVHIDNKNVERDAIAALSPSGKAATVTIQNSRIDNILGSKASVHGDVFQPHGPIGDLRVFNVTGETSCQGFFLAPQNHISSVTMENVDIDYLPGGDPQTWAYYFVDNSTMGSLYPVSLKNVYVDERDGQNAEQSSVYPPTSLGGAVRNGDTITWPKLPYTGSMTVGDPKTASGDFVDNSQIGLGYTRDLSKPVVYAPTDGSTTPTSPTPPTSPGDGSTTPTSPTGSTSITVNASGTVAGGVYAHFKVLLDGKAIGEGTTTGTAKDFTFKTDAATGQAHKVQIQYDNDGAVNGADRNLIVNKVTINGHAVNPTDSNVTYDKGALDGVDVIKGQSKMWWGGTLVINADQSYFQTSSTAPTAPTPPTTGGTNAAAITVNASGSAAGGTYAHFKLLVDGKAVGEGTTTSTAKDFTFKTSLTADQAHKVQVQYDNDGSVNGQDRNLIVNKVTINGHASNATASNVTYDKGALDGQDVVKGQSGMWWNGTLVVSADKSWFPASATTAGTATAQSLDGATNLWTHVATQDTQAANGSAADGTVHYDLQNSTTVGETTAHTLALDHDHLLHQHHQDFAA
ncbi:carbohydrate-binding domain-containing protein [Azospirillum rugosum]|uniref:Carbohydrate binding module xylan-binding domain-containing protein n=1 Tax=Azospirillum rugosum TaxID=416170 RepID=A0ABS4SG09_9PROT|nr:carbohydrate-binding domain-containing protein [Azospirillum rugosum]MBP2291432.1 hypothetical protein [Azospirillum rugosum]MDQ0525220.1 hypothetical protein [Azospirillum rugosum]